MRTSKTTNNDLKLLISELRKVSSVEEVALWKRIATDLSKPTRQRRAVNLSRINKFTKENDVVVVPGKVLSVGDIDHKLEIAAYQFSEAAKNKIESAKGKVITLPELLKSNPKGKGIKIIG
jgi:large subunit ribosomal protein L18e